MVKRAGGALLLSITIDPDSPRPVSTQLYVALCDLILAGGFAVGERLPASRTLALELHLARGDLAPDDSPGLGRWGGRLLSRDGGCEGGNDQQQRSGTQAHQRVS